MGAVYRYLDTDYLLYKYLVDAQTLDGQPNPTLSFGNKTLNVKISTPSDARLYAVHVSETPGFTPSQDNYKFGISTADGTVNATASATWASYAVTYYVKVVPYPNSGPAGTPSNEISGVFYAGSVATPSFAVAAGTYQAAQTITLSSPDANVTYRYTTDGSDPTSMSPVFTSISLYGGTTTLKVKGFRLDYQPSAVISATYTVNQSVSLLASGATNSATITLSWGSVAGASGYKLYTDNGSGGTVSNLVYDGVATSYPHQVTAGTVYRYQVKAYGANWETALSQEVSATAYLGTLAAVSFSLAQGTYTSTQSITLSHQTAGVSIYYTLDGTTPSESSTLYTSEISVVVTKTVKVFAVKTGWLSSAVSTQTYTINRQAPSFTSIAGRNISSDPNKGYFDLAWGSTPNATGYKIYAKVTNTAGEPVLYHTLSNVNSAAVLMDPGVWLRLYISSYGDGWETAKTPANDDYITYLGTVADPVFVPEGGTYGSRISVAISSSTTGATVLWAIGAGAYPTGAYTSPITMVSQSTVLRARAVKAGWIDSQTAQQTYTLDIPGPVISAEGTVNQPASGGYAFNLSWTAVSEATSYHVFASAAPGVTDQSTEVFSGSSLSATVGLPAGTKYFAVYAKIAGSVLNSRLSNEASATSYSGIVSNVGFSISGGTYQAIQQVVLSTSTVGAEIRYTLNGSEPTQSSSLYSGPVRIASSLTLKAKAFKTNFTPSQVTSQTYTVAIPGPSVSPVGSENSAEISLSWNSVVDAVSYRVHYAAGPGVTTSDPYLTVTGATSTVHQNVTPGVAYWYAVKGIGADFETELGSVQAGTAYLGTVATPAISLAPGAYFGTQPISISCATSGADIFYTLDGSTPQIDPDEAYDGAFGIVGDVTLYAKAFKQGYRPSAVAGGYYDLTVPGPVVTLSKTELAPAEKITASVSTDGIALYPKVQAASPDFQDKTNWRWITFVYTNQNGKKRFDGFDARANVPVGVIQARDPSGSTLTLQRVYIVLSDRRRLRLNREDLDDPENFDFSIV